MPDARAAAVGRAPRLGRLPDGACSLRAVAEAINTADSWTVKCVRDLERAPGLFPSRGQAHAFGVRLFAMAAHARGVIDALSPAVASGGPRAGGAPHARPDADALAAVWLVERLRVR